MHWKGVQGVGLGWLETSVFRWKTFLDDKCKTMTLILFIGFICKQ